MNRTVYEYEKDGLFVAVTRHESDSYSLTAHRQGDEFQIWNFPSEQQAIMYAEVVVNNFHKADSG